MLSIVITFSWSFPFPKLAGNRLMGLWFSVRHVSEDILAREIIRAILLLARCSVVSLCSRTRFCAWVIMLYDKFSSSIREKSHTIGGMTLMLFHASVSDTRFGPS